MDKEEAFARIKRSSRDNARTPMQWDSSQYAGFSTVDTWIEVNPNYVDINVENQINDETSILHFYRNLIAFRKANEIVVYGTYEPLFEENETIFAYKRTLGEEVMYVLCNFTDKEVKIPSFEYEENEKDLAIHNDTVWEKGMLRPYEARVYLVK